MAIKNVREQGNVNALYGWSDWLDENPEVKQSITVTHTAVSYTHLTLPTNREV